MYIICIQTIFNVVYSTGAYDSDSIIFVFSIYLHYLLKFVFLHKCIIFYWQIHKRA